MENETIELFINNIPVIVTAYEMNDGVMIYIKTKNDGCLIKDYFIGSEDLPEKKWKIK